MNKLTKIFTTILFAFVLVASLAITPGMVAQAVGAPPQVVCVPATALNPAVPHDTWSGLETTLKCVAHDPEGDHTLATYEWDYGDGSPVETGAVSDPYAIEAGHTYVGNIGDLFVATLRVTDGDGLVGSDQYLVQIKDGSKLSVRVNVAIDEGLWRLHKDQQRFAFPDGTPGGYWEYEPNSVAATGASTEAFEIQGSLPGGNPDVDPYVETVQRGLNYLLSVTYSEPVSQDPILCPLGDPDSNGNEIGLISCTDCWHSMYESGIVLMALASSRCPDCIAATGAPDVVGRSYLDIAQDMVDYFAYGQSDPDTGDGRGGWRYYGNFREWGEGQYSDNSVSQWPVIGMESAEVNFGSFGLVVPQFVKDELNLWIDYIQNDVDGDWVDGGSGYTAPWDWVNVAKTGGLLAEMKFVGDTTSSSRVQAAVDFIDRRWDLDEEHIGANSYYAFYSVMKGFRLLGIETFGPLNDPSGFDWYQAYAEHIVADQSSDGAWYYGMWSSHPLNSAWAILTLKKTVVQPGPVADAGPDVPDHPPVIPVTFNGSGSYHRDPGRSIVQYIWDFGDGSLPQEGAIVTHAYPAVYNPDGSIDWEATIGDYVVTLTVVDDSEPALTDSDTTFVHITAPPWPPVADANGPYTVEMCQPLTLDGSGSYDPNGELYPDPSHPWHGEIVSWEWDLDNDGEYDDASGESVAWSSCEPGVHVVGLRVTNSFGESDEVDTVINVVEPVNFPPVADANGPYEVAEHLSIILDGSGSSDPDGDELSYGWDFGYGGGFEDATGMSPTYVEDDPGLHPIALRVCDPHGACNIDETTVTVTNMEPVIRVRKTANVKYALTTGAEVVYTLRVQNNSVATDPVVIASIVDDIYGDILDPGNTGIYGVTCGTDTIQPGGTYLCRFKVWLQSDILGEHTNTVTVTVQDDEGSEATGSDEATVTVLPPSAATDSSLCYYDREPGLDGQQFRLIFTPDMQTWPAYKLPASNPGQFFYNVFYTGKGPASFTIALPEPFETQGAQPVHVYTEVAVIHVDGFDCFVPDPASEIYAGDSLDLSGVPVPNGFVYVAVHADYGLKGTTGYGQNYDGDAVDVETGEVLIGNLSDYTFAVSGSQNDSQTIQNVNAFKRMPGVAGLVTDGMGDPLEGVQVEFYAPDGGLMSSEFSDEDGWYMFEYKHIGRPAVYTVRLPGYGLEQSVKLKGNGFAEASFVVE